MKRGIPTRGIPRPQPAGTRLPQLQPVVVVKTPVVQAPRRVIAPIKTVPKVRSAPVIAAASKSRSRIIGIGPAPQVISKPIPVVKKLPAPRQSLFPSRSARPSFGFTRKVPRAPQVVQVASPVVTIPASPVMAPVSIPVSPVRIGNDIVMVPDEVLQVTPQRSPVRAVVVPPLSPVAASFACEPVSPLGSMIEPDEFSCLSPPSPVGLLNYSYSPDLATEIANMSVSFAPDPAFSPVRSPTRYGYVDVSPITGEIMPAEFSMFSPELYDEPSQSIYNESVLLQSPSRGQPVVLDVEVNPQLIVSSPLGLSRGFRRGRAREGATRGLFGDLYPSYRGLDLDRSIEWESPEDLVNEYNNMIGASQYQGDDLISFLPIDLIDFSSPNY